MSSGAPSPAAVVLRFLDALADDEGDVACGLLTEAARERLAEAADLDCAEEMHRRYLSLGPRAPRVKGGRIRSIRSDPVSATVVVELHGREAEVELEKVGADWLIGAAGLSRMLLEPQRGVVGNAHRFGLRRWPLARRGR